MVETLNDLVQHVENEVVEFKLASNNFDLHKLGQYFSAISNEANLRNKKYGWLIFGVDDTTHEFRGTNYKNNPVSLEKLKLEIAQELGLDSKVMESGWRSLTAKESGRIGGLMTKKRRESYKSIRFKE